MFNQIMEVKMNQTQNQKTTNSNFFRRKIRIQSWTLLLIVLFSSSLVGHAQGCQKSKEKTSLSKNLTKLSSDADLEQIKKTLNENPDLVNHRLKNDETFLTDASWQGDFEIAEYLISRGIDVNLRNKWDNTALHNAAQKGHAKLAALLLENGAKINARGNSGNTPLHSSVLKKQAEVATLLIDKGATVDASNDYNQTPLVYASWGGNPDIIWTLVENGADVNYAAMADNTILHNLAANGNTKSIKIVLDKGANANSVDKNGNLPIHNAVKNRNADAVWMLLEHTSDINLQETNLGNTPLHIAAINGDLKSSEILSKAGADPQIKNNSGKTAVDYAVKYGYSDVVGHYVSNKIAPKQTLKLTAENKAMAMVGMGTDEAKIVYCGHSGWVVETENHFLVFDYWSRAHSKDPSLVNGSISPEEIKDKNVIVFASHNHKDHYDPIIHTWADKVDNIKYVYGFQADKTWDGKEKAYEGPDYNYIESNQQKVINGADITTFKSTDSGQGFLVKADGITIYHPGDHAWFAAEDEEPFKKEVDFIADKTSTIDIAFLPVSGCPSRWKKENIIAGFMYSLENLNPTQVYPMHALQREYAMKEFAELAAEKNSPSQIVCTENIGDNFQFNKAIVAAK